MNPVWTCYVQKPEEDDKINFELEKKVKNKFFSSYPSFVFALYTLISPNLHIILKKDLHTHVNLKEKPLF